MLVALVDFTVDPTKRDVALGRLLSDVEVVAGMPGCQTFRPY